MSGPTKILVVDDDAANRYFKTHVLAQRGYQVIEADCGAAALATVEKAQPAIVLLDVKLPDVNGIELCRTIKQRFPGTLVLQTSAALVQARDRAAGLEGGADSYLAEPIEPEELTAQVGALVRLHRAEYELRRLNDELERRVTERTKELVQVTGELATESRKRAQVEEAFRHAEKLDAVGQLTGGLAHDFNNLLMVVLGNLDNLERRLAAPGPVAEGVAQPIAAARSAAQDGASLTRQLLAFSRRDMVRPEVLSANDAFDALSNLLAKAVGERVTLDFDVCAEPWLIKVERTRLEAALLNLVVNARDAMPSGGVVRISSRNMAKTSPALVKSQAVLAVDAEPGDYVEISVADRGSGISEQVLKHAFEPFFTTKEVGRGTGLGLSQVYGFVRQAKGFLAVETATGVGTTFRLFLPRTLQARAPDAATDAETSFGGTETILVVEDNSLVLEVVLSAVGELGYRALQAASAPQALEILASDQPIDLLFTDMVLPGMSGLELARRAQQLRPKLKVLLTSGYAGRAPGALSGNEFLVLSKPYQQDALARRLREALAQDLVTARG